MLIIIGALFYSLGIYVGRNWNKITKELTTKNKQYEKEFEL